LIAFFAVLAGKCFDVFDGGSLEGFKAISLVHLFDDADHIIAPPHIGGEKVAHAARRLGSSLTHSYLKIEKPP
jgi:hypothetical protein